MIIVIGHKNPDSDAAISSLLFSKYLKLKGEDAMPGLAGEPNSETEFIFSYFKQTLPQIFLENDLLDKRVFLVDHNDLSQSIAKAENISGILDHHLIAGIKTDYPLFFRVEPIGSTSSLIYKMFKEANFKINSSDAGLILAGIISDTLNLKSPTTTQEDIAYYKELVKISGENPDNLANKMFEIKSDFSKKSLEDILSADLKEYSFGDKKIIIAVAETTSLVYFDDNEQKILEVLIKIKKERNYDAMFFGAVDIVNSNTRLYPAGAEEEVVVKKIFKIEKSNSYFLLSGVSSRKKEIAPPISEYYSNL